MPLRTCLITRQKREKGNLVRIAKIIENNSEKVRIGVKSGRGAYIATDIEVFKKLRKSKRNPLRHFLRLTKPMTEEDWQRLEEEFKRELSKKS
jgi:predicted RNA-binding protein YlxR (DUF448 family)